MAVLKWLVTAAVAITCGYFGFMLSGWPGAAAAAAGAALAVNLLFGEQWVLTVVTVLFSTYLVFFGLTDYGGQAQSKAAARQAELAQGRQGGAPGAPASGAKRAPATAAAAPPADGAKPTAQPAADGGRIIQDCRDCPSLVVLAPGRFDMGSRPGEGVDARELPQHRVSVASFAAGRYAVTKGEFGAFVKATGYKTEAERDGGCFVWAEGGWGIDTKRQWHQAGIAQGEDHPVVCVSWNDAHAYADWLSQVTGHHYRLFSEAEREYAARAGSGSAFWWGDSLSADKANYGAAAGQARSDALPGTVPVNQFGANPFGLYNVHGNVWEWVEDCRHDNYAGAPGDGSAWTSGCVDERRVLRGGGWIGQPAALRAASRAWFTPDFRSQIGGFRVARDL